MKAVKLLILLLLVLLLISSVACINEEKKQQDYQKCTEVCASVLTEDYVTLHLCNEECKEQFLNST
jgi:hypothetical protein